MLISSPPGEDRHRIERTAGDRIGDRLAVRAA